MPQSYLTFVYRGDTLNPTQTLVMDAMPNRYMENATATAWFGFLYVILPRLIKKQWPELYKELGQEKQDQLCSWATGFFHHLVVAPFGFYLIWRDYQLDEATYKTMDYATSVEGLHMLQYCFGYILADTFFYTIGEMKRGKFEFAIHHVASLALYYGMMGASGAICRFCPFFYICELSGAIFNAAFFVRNAGGRDTFALKALEIFFALAFFFTRVVSLPVAIHAMLSLESVQALGPVRYTLVLIALLQFYWFLMIIRSLQKKKSPTSDKAKGL